MNRKPRSRPAALQLFVLAPALIAGIVLDAASPGVTLAADPGIRARASHRPAPSREIYGYLPYWQLGSATARGLDYAHLSTLAFFAIPVGPSGALDRRSPGYRAYVSSAARTVTNAAHARGVRVVPTFQVFRVSTLRRLLDSPSAQRRFIREALDVMARRRADGANLDVEPIPTGLAAKYAAFVGRFGRAMHRRFTGSELAVATPAIVSDSVLRPLEPVVDRMFVMTYDYHAQGSTLPGPVAPLESGPHNVVKTIKNYLRIVPAGKVILGIPYYGYSWPVQKVGGTWRVRPDPGRVGGVRAVTYASVRAWLAQNPSIRVHDDPATGAWFRYLNRSEGTARQIQLESASSATRKFNYAIASGIAGVGIWALGNDAGIPTLSRAIDRTFVRSVRRVNVYAIVQRVRVVGGRVLVDAFAVLRDRGTRAERGWLSWRVVDGRGRTLQSSRRVAAVYPGSRPRFGIAISLGSPMRLRAGTYRLAVRFSAESSLHAADAVRFRQRF